MYCPSPAVFDDPGAPCLRQPEDSLARPQTPQDFPERSDDHLDRTGTEKPMSVPSLPVAHQRALALLSNSNVSVHALSEVLEADPGLTAALLRASNSAAYAPLKRIGTANQAIVRIGLEVTRRVIASAALSSGFESVARSGLDAQELWQHALATALLSDASAWAEGPRTEAFTGGLLHSIGRLALAADHPEQYRQVVERVQAGEDSLAVESDVFGHDSVEWGIQVATAWDFPRHIVEAIGHCRTGEGSPLAWVVWNARRIAWSLGYGDGLERPDAVTFDPMSDDASIVGSLGGPEGLRSQIEWYQGSLTEQAA